MTARVWKYQKTYFYSIKVGPMIYIWIYQRVSQHKFFLIIKMGCITPTNLYESLWIYKLSGSFSCVWQSLHTCFQCKSYIIVDKVIGIDAGIGNLVKQRGCGNWKIITSRAWLWVLVFKVILGVRKKEFLLYLLAVFNCDINPVSKLEGLHNFSVWCIS